MSTDDLKIINTRKLAKALAVGIEDRGPHATGVAFRAPSGSSPIQIHKAPVCATQFIKRMPMPRSAQVGLVHTRYATQGSPENRLNNHPIANGGIVGVHNGHVTNDDYLFKMVEKAGGERHGEVDSEAIFAAIAWNVATWEPKHREIHIGDVLESVRGGAAIAWLDESDPDDILHISRLSSSPLVMSWTVNGSLIFASELPAIKAAAAAVGVDIVKTVYVLEGTKYTVKAGDITNKVDFTPPWRRSYTSVSSRSMVDSWGDTDNWDEVRGSILVPRPIPLPAVGRASEEDTTPPARTLADVLDDIKTRDMEEELADTLVSPRSLARTFGEGHYNRYRQREAAIDKFRDSFSDELGKQRAEIMARVHAFVRVGTWVKTTINGAETTGQIYTMPDTFPWGAYVLRVLSWNDNRPHDEEWVLVARNHGEFEVHENQNLKSNGDLDAAANVVLTEEDKAIILAQEAEEEATTMSTSEDGDLEVAMDWALEKEESKSLQEIDR